MPVDQTAMAGQQDHFLFDIRVLSHFTGKQMTNLRVGNGVWQSLFGFPGHNLFEFLFGKLRPANVLHEQFLGTQATHNPAALELMVGNQFAQRLRRFAVLFLRRQTVVSRHFRLCQRMNSQLPRRAVKLYQSGRVRVQMQPDGMCYFAFE